MSTILCLLLLASLMTSSTNAKRWSQEQSHSTSTSDSQSKGGHRSQHSSTGTGAKPNDKTPTGYSMAGQSYSMAAMGVGDGTYGRTNSEYYDKQSSTGSGLAARNK